MQQRVVTSDGLPKVLEDGGQMQYRPRKDRRRHHWELWARRVGDHRFRQVISSKTGGPRIFKSANALFAFHLRMFPDAEGVFIPAIVDVTHEFSEERRKDRSGSIPHDVD